MPVTFAPEQLVRPFLPRRFGPALAGRGVSNPPPPEVVVIKWAGEGGKIYQYEYTHSSRLGDAPSDTYTETKRVSEKKRIENPNDPTQFVEFNRAKEITGRSGKGISGDRTKLMTWRYKYPADDK